eukprot:TRINITY_DN3949_c0_g1_i4.p1 TRINITY_DN3949_c0_g1~~TRINITY_DN3949_c0_g1_i4.p1  ORF type:complete len:139 (-),score=20.74 TRINITY_DN3949_c0_g1_i4:347-763(-)
MSDTASTESAVSPQRTANDVLFPHARRVLQVGETELRTPCAIVAAADLHSDAFSADSKALIDTLAWFRHTFGFGRAVAAPQIGVMKRMIALNLGDGPFLMVNPVITWRSDQVFSLWDDCMSSSIALDLEYADSHCGRF